jgi:hypothetical protein
MQERGTAADCPFYRSRPAWPTLQAAPGRSLIMAGGSLGLILLALHKTPESAAHMHVSHVLDLPVVPRGLGDVIHLGGIPKCTVYVCCNTAVLQREQCPICGILVA